MTKVLITGACGFVGSAVARVLVESFADMEMSGLDNLWRPGSETNRHRLRMLGIRMQHSDLRSASDFENLDAFDWVVDAAANASVVAGLDGATTPRQLLEHNLVGTINILEYCRRVGAGLVLLSSSRVYSIDALKRIPLAVKSSAFTPEFESQQPGLSSGGITESFPTTSPISLYGATKLASENLALEYSSAFGLPVWINRCGVLSGAGQFGQPAQGIFSWWINKWQKRKSLRYTGFGGQGFQVRDCFHPSDLAELIGKQIQSFPAPTENRTFNIAGGLSNAMSLAQLSGWCEQRFGPLSVESDAREREFDVPWVALDYSKARERWDWSPSKDLPSILNEIADHAEAHSDWLEISEG